MRSISRMWNMQIRRTIEFPRMGGIYTDSDLFAAMTSIRAAMNHGGNFFPNPEQLEFERAIAAHEGAAHGVAVSSCATALDACMAALDVGPGDEVITTPLTFVCTASTVLMRGAKVVFADIDSSTLNIDPQSVRDRINGRTKAIIGMHYGGLPCDMDALESAARTRNIPVIYDAAHALGAAYAGRPIGGRGTAVCYSFQFHKVMTCLGEGGALTTNDASFADKIRRLRSFGFVYPSSSTFDGGVVEAIGTNYQMTKVQCAVGLSQLRGVDQVIRARRARMHRLLEGLASIRGIVLPQGHGEDHGSLLFVVRVDDQQVPFSADELRAVLQDDFGIETSRHYLPIWSWPALQRLGYDGSGCPVASRVASQLITLPVWPRMELEDCDYIADCVRSAAAILAGPGALERSAAQAHAQ